VGVGRFHLIHTYGRAVLSSADPDGDGSPDGAMQYILGQGDGAAGYSPPTTLILRRCYMDTTHLLVNASGARELEFNVYKNGANSGSGSQAAAATVGTVLYNLHLPVDVAGSEKAEDTTSHIILPTDYITACVGHDIEQGPGNGAGTSGSLDNTFILEGEFDHSSGGGIDEDGRFTLFYLNGFNNSLVTLWLMGQSSGTDGWSPAEPVRIRRMLFSGNITVTHGSNTVDFAIYKNGVTGAELLESDSFVPSGLGEFLVQTLCDHLILPTDEFYVKFSQTAGGGPPGIASILELVLIIEAEYV
jgi:hypothetical protein